MCLSGKTPSAPSVSEEESSEISISDSGDEEGSGLICALNMLTSQRSSITQSAHVLIRLTTGSLVEPAGEDRGEGESSRSGVPSRGDVRMRRRARGRG